MAKVKRKNTVKSGAPTKKVITPADLESRPCRLCGHPVGQHETGFKMWLVRPWVDDARPPGPIHCRMSVAGDPCRCTVTVRR
jgi:hypothetical protein